MLLREYVQALGVATLLIAINPTGALSAEQAANDWLRGSGQDLQICLRGEVFESDGQSASDFQITCGMNSSGQAPQLKPTIDGHNFEVWIPVNDATWSSLWLKAASARSNHVAYKKLGAYELRQAAIDRIKLTLRSPSRHVKVKVTDEGQPVNGAMVKADLGFGVESRSQTDSNGIARIDLLPEQTLSHLTAWTNDFRIGGFGFDRKPTRDPNVDEHVVELSKCRDQKLRFVDEDGSPVPGVECIIQMATAPPNYNYIGTNENSRLRTDAAGEIAYRWFPDWDEHHFYAELITSGWFLDGEPEAVDDAIVFRLMKSKERKQVSGRVVSNDTGVGGFYVTLMSFQGERENHSDVTTTFADSDGTFTISVLPDATYCAYVLDSLWVGEIIDLIPYQSALEQITPPELSVSAGQKVEVLVTSGPQKAPYPNLTVSFRREHQFSWIEDGEKRNGTGGPQWWATADELGRATTHTLPGKLRGSVYTPKWRTEETVNVVSGETARIELHREIDEKRTVTGRLVLPDGVEANPEDVTLQVGAVDGHYTDQETLTASEDGSFSFETLATAIGVFGYTQNGQAAGSIVVKDLGAPFELELRPTSNYEGLLLGEGDQPLVGHGVRASVRVEGDEVRNAPASTSFQAKRIDAQTDEHGNFTLQSVPTGMEVSIFADPLDGSGDREFLDEILLEPGEARPRTVSRLVKAPQQRYELPLANRYDETLRDCSASGFRLMVILSSPGEVDEFVQDNFVDHERNRDVYTFMQMLVSINAESLSGTDAAFFKERNWELPGEGHAIAYAIDADGKELEHLEIDARDEAAAAEAAEFVRRHALPKADAEEKWAEAFAEAKRSNRRVLARVSQRYCGPCFRLARWLDDEHELLEKDYVMIKVDNFHDQNGADVALRITQGKHHGIPFFAIFDQDEELLINSAGPLGNIGYPGGDVESRNHLRKMLLKTRRNLSVAEVDQLVESIED
ncbi:MAG: thioredoxin family protein [Pirellulales bacterium]